jgi:acyl-[acyl-carrier-protein]-phospholipid O-acyltransferase/long-chain-fatty-acid--[acyl-carrier-protein] ligase
MVSLETVESIARAAAPYQEHAATSLPDVQRGEQIVLLTTDASLSRVQLSEAAKRLGMPDLAVPRRVQVVIAIPLLGSGKTDYQGVKHMAEATV